MAAHQKKIKVPLMLGVGAAFDFHSGTRRWAPAWIRKIGMEWFYRMLTGGRRVFIRNLKYESAFTWLILKQVARKMFGSNKTPC
jgi:N-acetylglucosaminyldiphosphoundecaprenol N-acetyl-beta-D-mannosaminyltransferase